MPSSQVLRMYLGCSDIRFHVLISRQPIEEPESMGITANCYNILVTLSAFSRGPKDERAL